jgi:hypothetical protein
VDLWTLDLDVPNGRDLCRGGSTAFNRQENARSRHGVGHDCARHHHIPIGIVERASLDNGLNYLGDTLMVLRCCSSARRRHAALPSGRIVHVHPDTEGGAINENRIASATRVEFLPAPIRCWPHQRRGVPVRSARISEQIAPDFTNAYWIPFAGTPAKGRVQARAGAQPVFGYAVILLA